MVCPSSTRLSVIPVRHFMRSSKIQCYADENPIVVVLDRKNNGARWKA